jgi:AAA+ ATPase superfamily predicted ATPase
VIVRGRRRIGKSALVEEFIEQQEAPSVFYTAEIGFGGEPLREFSEAVRVSGLREAPVFGEAVPGNWSAQLSLAAEFPDQAQARMVLAAIGSGERTFTNIARAAGGIAHSTLSRAAELLISKGVVAGELPVSLSPSKERRYRITDSYLRFWLAFLGPHLAEVDRMRSDLTLARIERSWTDWRGRAVEPLVREAIARLLPAQGIPAAPVIGGYWTRSNDVEIDIVGADRGPVAKQLLFLGSVKWLETGQFDDHDLIALQRHRDRITPDPVPLIAVSRAGTSAAHLDAAFTPADLIEAW